jgi:predicted DNA-binding transcriptional regulator AlpA
MNSRHLTTESILVDSRKAAAMLGFSLSHFYAMANSGRIGPQPLSFGKSKRYVVEELRQWAQAGCPRREVWVAKRRV